jgi:hypothetical protein
MADLVEQIVLAACARALHRHRLAWGTRHFAFERLLPRDQLVLVRALLGQHEGQA